MGLLSRKPPPDGVARLSFDFDDRGEVTGVWPEWDGDDALLFHLPGMVWDEYLAYVRDNRQDRLDAFLALVEFCHTGTWLDDPSELFFEPVPFLAEPPAGAHGVATIAARLDYPRQRTWTESRFAPKEARDLLFYLSPLVVWDWTFRLLLDAGADNEMDALMTNLGYQAHYYSLNGVASDFFLKNIGRAPFFAAMSGNRDRLVAEIALHAGITVEEFDAMSREERNRVVAVHTHDTMEEFNAAILNDLDRREPQEEP